MKILKYVFLKKVNICKYLKTTEALRKSEERKHENHDTNANSEVHLRVSSSSICCLHILSAEWKIAASRRYRSRSVTASPFDFTKMVSSMYQ